MRLVRAILEAVAEKEFTPRGDVLEPEHVLIGALFQMLTSHGWSYHDKKHTDEYGAPEEVWFYVHPKTTVHVEVYEKMAEAASGILVGTGVASRVLAVSEDGPEELSLDPDLAREKLDELVVAHGGEKYPLNEPGIANTAAGHTLWDFGPGYKVVGDVEDHGLDIWGPDTGAIANTAEEAKKIFGWLRANYQGHISVFDVYDDEEPLLVELNNAGLVDVWYPIGESPAEVVAKFEGEKG